MSRRSRFLPTIDPDELSDSVQAARVVVQDAPTALLGEPSLRGVELLEWPLPRVQVGIVRGPDEPVVAHVLHHRRHQAVVGIARDPPAAGRPPDCLPPNPAELFETLQRPLDDPGLRQPGVLNAIQQKLAHV